MDIDEFISKIEAGEATIRDSLEFAVENARVQQHKKGTNSILNKFIKAEENGDLPFSLDDKFNEKKLDKKIFDYLAGEGKSTIYSYQNVEDVLASALADEGIQYSKGLGKELSLIHI